MRPETTEGKAARRRGGSFWARLGISRATIALALVVVAGAFVARHFILLGRRKKPAAAESKPASGPLPYINYVAVTSKDRGKVGTTVYDKARAFSGYNLYFLKPETAGLLFDMQGEVVHRWNIPAPDPKLSRGVQEWGFVKMQPNGDLLALNGGTVWRLDWDSNILWKAKVHGHHDLVPTEGGDVYVIFARPRRIELGGKARIIFDHGVAILAPDGEVKKSISVFDVFMANEALKKQLAADMAERFAELDRAGMDEVLKHRKNPLPKGITAERIKELFDGPKEPSDVREAPKLMSAVPGELCDVFHTNTVVPLKAHPGGIWKDGDLLISLRHQDILIAFDPNTLEAHWTWGPGEVGGQHQPSVLANGNILLFDNGTPRGKDGARKVSRVVELDPVERKIVWTYEADPPTSMYVTYAGGCQLLPNGDILVAESRGRAFEITRSKEIVWEWFNKMDKNGKKRIGMYRMERIPTDVVTPLLARAPGPSPATTSTPAPPVPEEDDLP